MRTWMRATHWHACGSEPACRIAPGDVFLELRIGELHRVLRRCAAHAGEAPHDVQEPDITRVERAPSTAKPLRWLATQAEQKVRRMTPRGAFDARAAAARNGE